MSTLSTVLAVLLPVLCLAVAIMIGVVTMRKSGNAKRAFARHFLTLAVALVLSFGGVCFASAAGTGSADADDTTATTSTSAAATEEKSDKGAGLAAGLGFIGSGLSIGLAAVGAGVALASGAPAAIGAVAEDPKSFGKSMIFVALGEAVAIYGFIIAFLIILRLPSGITL